MAFHKKAIAGAARAHGHLFVTVIMVGIFHSMEVCTEITSFI
jgi:hypothetical protein